MTTSLEVQGLTKALKEAFLKVQGLTKALKEAFVRTWILQKFNTNLKIIYSWMWKKKLFY